MNRKRNKEENISRESRFRYLELRSEQINSDERTLTVPFSSETPVEVWRDEFEVLSHDSASVQMEFLGSGSAPLLYEHNRNNQIGVVEKAWIDPSEKRGWVKLRFSKNRFATEIFNDVTDGIRKNISVGYRVKDYETTERSDGTLLITVKSWMPYEVSIVSVPADTGVGVGRSYRELVEKEKEEEVELNLFNGEDKNRAGSATEESSKPASENQSVPVAKVDETAIRKKAEEEIQTRHQEIMSLGEKYNLQRTAYECVLKNESVETAKERMLEKMSTGDKEKPFAGEVRSDAGKELNNYSFLRVFNAVRSNDWKEAGFERAVHKELMDKYGDGGNGGFRFPMNLPTKVPAGMRNMRSISIGDTLPGTSAGNLVQRSYLPFVDMLFSAMVLDKLGATTLTDLKGVVEFAKLKSYSAGGWIGEDDPAGDASSEFSTIKMNPYTCAGKDYITRNALNQSSEDMEMMVRFNLMRAIKRAVEIAAFVGTGAADTPTGLINISDVNTHDFAADDPTYAELVDMETKIDSDEALFGALKYFITKDIKGYCRKTLDFPTSKVGKPIAQGGLINEYPYIHSNRCPAKTVIFGNWMDLLVGVWGAPEILAERDTAKGGMSISLFMDVDVNTRHPESFCIGKKPSSS